MKESKNNDPTDINGVRQKDGKQDKKGKLGAILDRAKSSPITAAAILSAAFVVLAAVTITAFLSSAEKHLYLNQNPLPKTVVQKQKSESYEEISSAPTEETVAPNDEVFTEKTKEPEVSPPTSAATVADKNSFGLTPPKHGKGKIAIVIDDAGSNLFLADRLTKLKIPMVIAILPHTVSSKETADLARTRGKSVFLHYPMEPLNYPSDDPGEGAVLLSMPEMLIQAVSKNNVENLGQIDGFNNHMGSAVTENPVKMRQIMESMRLYANTFVDSKTSNKSVAYEVCLEAGFSCGINRKFLDNSNEHSYIASKMYEAAELAEKQGGVIVIGHLRIDTIAVLETVVPELQKLGYQFVPINSITTGR